MREVNGKPYREFRCKNCRALLCLEYIYAGRISIKCPRCGEINTTTIKSPKSILLRQSIDPAKIDIKK